MASQSIGNGSGSRRLVRAQATTFTARRIDTIVGRFYSIALLLATIEVATNAFEQKHLLNPLAFWLIFGAYLGSNLVLGIANWFFEASSKWYLLNALVILCCVIAWPLAVPKPELLPEGFAPFIWWMTGWGGISAGLALNQYLAGVYIALLPTLFALVQLSKAGGNAPTSVGVQNGIYTFLISAVMTGVIMLLRWRARQQDIAAQVAAESASEAAAQAAIADERLRVASLVHNQVLSALNSAINAHGRDAEKTAANLASAAIDRLTHFEQEVAEQPQSVSVNALFDALSRLVKDQSEKFTVASSVEGDLEVPINVANALTEATLQAVTNSLMHAGSATKLRRVSLKAAAGALKITVVDDGKGFWHNRVPKNRLGIRMIIYRRVAEVGAESHINSKPGEGTSVVLEWSSHD